MMSKLNPNLLGQGWGSMKAIFPKFTRCLHNTTTQHDVKFQRLRPRTFCIICHSIFGRGIRFYQRD